MDLNFTARRFQRVGLGIVAEGGKADETGILRLLRHLNQLVSLPEFGKRRQRHLLLGAAPGGHLIEGLQPLQIALPFGKALAAARLPAFAEVGKDREIIARFTLRGDHLLHRHQMLIAVVPGHRQIVALKRGGRRQDDIGMTRGGGPKAFGDDDKLWFLPGLNQAVGILMMGKVGAAGPPDKANIGEAPRHAVVLILRPRVLQRLDNPRDRDLLHGVHASGHAPLHRAQHRRAAGRIAAVGEMVGKTKPAPRGANLPQHRSQGDQHPVFLLAILLALHAPARHQHSGVFVEKFRQFADLIRCDAADSRRPVGGFRHAVAFAGQIAGKNLVAAGAAGKKLVVLPAILHQRMGDTQHQRDVGAHMRRDPLHRIAKEIDSFRSHRIDADQAFSALAQPVEPRDTLLVGGVPGNFQRIQRVGAPQHHYLAVFQHQRPAGLLLIHLIAAHDVRHDRLRRAGGVIPEMAGVAARQAHIALQQGGRLMQDAVRTPAVGAGKNRGRSVAFADPTMLGIDQIQRLLPAHPHKFILTADPLGLVRRGKETFAHHRVAHAGFTVHLVAHRRLQRVGKRCRQRAAGGKDVFPVRFHQHRSPMGGG